MKIKIFLPVWLGGFLLIYGFNDIAAAGWAVFAPIIYLFIIGVCVSTKALNWVVRQLLDLATGHERIEADIGLAELVYVDWDKPKEKERAKALLYEEQKGYCPGCLEKFPIRNLSIDHIEPQAYGGDHSFSNMQLLCNACNSTKSTRPQDVFLSKKKHLRAGKQVPEGIGKAADVLRKMDDLECMERRNKVRARWITAGIIGVASMAYLLIYG